jgi:hypothetical protein
MGGVRMLTMPAVHTGRRNPVHGAWRVPCNRALQFGSAKGRRAFGSTPTIAAVEVENGGLLG